MTIALASVPDRVGSSPYFIETLLQDKDGIIDDLIERYHTNELRSLFCQNAAANINRGNDVLIPNYADLPAPKINQLVIPTGATRWSYCLLLADQFIKEAVDAASAMGSRPMNLIYGSPVGNDGELGHIISLTVSILPPRRVSPNLENNNNLWLIPVVDARYWWQFLHTDDLSGDIEDAEPEPTTQTPNPQITPDELVDLLAEKLNETILNVGVNTNYKELPTCALTNDKENFPIVMDSIYAHYGQRLVVDIGCWNGTGYSQVYPFAAPGGSTRFAAIDGTNSQVVLTNSNNGLIGLQKCTWNVSSFDPTVSPSAGDSPLFFSTPQVVAGYVSNSFPTMGPYACVPYSVTVRTYDETYNTVTSAIISLVYSPFQDTNAVWRTKFEENTDIEKPPDERLYQQIARDYYYQFLHQFDYTIAGVQPWQQGYFDDYMVIRQTYNPNTKQYDAWTRVCSRQPNLTGEWTSLSDSARGLTWAVNIGSLESATHPLTGAKQGYAAILSKDEAFPKLKITDKRERPYRHDAGDTIEDGTLIQIDTIKGERVIVWADCEPHEDLTGLT